jgi:CRISPR-associated protein Csy1
LLTPSGLLTQVKSRIDGIRFSEETKQAKETRKKNEHHVTGYDDLFDLTVTAYGGTQPQNVSVLNSKNAGRAYLLASTPPKLK